MDALRGFRPRAAALIALAALGAGLALAAGELGLRAWGYRFTTFPVVQFGWPEPREIRDVYVPDRELFWVTRDYASKLAEARRTRPAIVFMGDSCTEFGSWPRLTLERLAARTPSLGRGVSLAVGGWSSEQGLRQFRRDVLPLHPRVVVVYYGWNDHWMAFGRPDAEVEAGPVSFWLTQHLRLAQLIVGARLGFDTASGANRVPRERYRANLEVLAGLARGAGIRAVFITAPAAHQRGHEPAYLARRHIRRLDELVPLHASYVEATREAAAAARTQVCDAAAAFDGLPGPKGQYFMRDGIHLSERGSLVLAQVLERCLVPDGR
jgi:lysophospholipase L1-like esterase